MIPALVTLKNLVKNKSYHIDYPLFRLHYQATVCALLTFCLILTAKILFGDTIDCKSRTLKRDAFYDNICYAQGTYTKYQVREFDHEYDSRAQYIYTGIMVPPFDKEVTAIFWHHYYQYIPIILFLQAIFFYFPHYLWKGWENGIISSICKQLHDNRFAPTEYIESNYHFVDYLKKCFTLHKSLVYKYYTCHMLLLINLVAQIVILDKIFNEQFIDYGSQVVKYLFINSDVYGLRLAGGNATVSDSLDLNSPMDFVFPKVTGCTVRTLSQAGDKPDETSFLCVLPLNILHDKFFLILWFWFLILAVITIVQVTYDALYTTMPMFRGYIFKRRFGSYLSEENRRSTSLSELFLLDLIGNNSDKFAFSALLKKLNKEDWPVVSAESRTPESFNTSLV